MTTASDKELGALHATVAKVLTQAISGEECSAAVLSVAVTFLKNNNITASPTDNAELAELNKQLAQRRAQGKERLKADLGQVDDLMQRQYGDMANGLQ